jgi:hypothetical protein
VVFGGYEECIRNKVKVQGREQAIFGKNLLYTLFLIDGLLIHDLYAFRAFWTSVFSPFIQALIASI